MLTSHCIIASSLSKGDTLDQEAKLSSKVGCCELLALEPVYEQVYEVENIHLVVPDLGKFILFLDFCNGVTLSFACISVSEKLFLVASGFICFKVVILVEGFICQ